MKNRKLRGDPRPQTCLREETTTEAPSKPRRSAMEKPMPWVEAVTMATLPSYLLPNFDLSICLTSWSTHSYCNYQSVNIYIYIYMGPSFFFFLEKRYENIPTDLYKLWVDARLRYFELPHGPPRTLLWVALLGILVSQDVRDKGRKSSLQ